MNSIGIFDNDSGIDTGNDTDIIARGVKNVNNF